MGGNLRSLKLMSSNLLCKTGGTGLAESARTVCLIKPRPDHKQLTALASYE